MRIFTRRKHTLEFEDPQLVGITKFGLRDYCDEAHHKFSSEGPGSPASNFGTFRRSSFLLLSSTSSRRKTLHFVPDQQQNEPNLTLVEKQPPASSSSSPLTTTKTLVRKLSRVESLRNLLKPTIRGRRRPKDKDKDTQDDDSVPNFLTKATSCDNLTSISNTSYKSNPIYASTQVLPSCYENFNQWADCTNINSNVGSDRIVFKPRRASFPHAYIRSKLSSNLPKAVTEDNEDNQEEEEEVFPNSQSYNDSLAQIRINLMQQKLVNTNNSNANVSAGLRQRSYSIADILRFQDEEQDDDLIPPPSSPSIASSNSNKCREALEESGYDSDSIKNGHSSPDRIGNLLITTGSTIITQVSSSTVVTSPTDNFPSSTTQQSVMNNSRQKEVKSDDRNSICLYKTAIVVGHDNSQNEQDMQPSTIATRAPSLRIRNRLRDKTPITTTRIPISSINRYCNTESVNNYKRTSNKKSLFVNNKSSSLSIFTVNFIKGENRKSLGFTFVGGATESARDSSLGIFVKRIFPYGQAAEDGTLVEGDEILSVNGQPLVDCLHSQVLGLFKSIKSGPITLQVARREPIPTKIPIPKLRFVKSSTLSTCYTKSKSCHQLNLM